MVAEWGPRHLCRAIQSPPRCFWEGPSCLDPVLKEERSSESCKNIPSMTNTSPARYRAIRGVSGKTQGD
ncbi:unnamed protein product [Dovyalis caffra]|uniref:Uncharacterized protein n=1 Tax=Dovyalis caffra TaxID=77055 RepID=A0AAV1S412_9ROSI|nr:unnamed protein product [Dovyalis caffra]